MPAQAAVRAGRVTFVVRNDGSMAHEFVVLRSDRRAGGLPVKGGKALELGRRGEIPEIASSGSKRLTMTLRSGKYVLLCNLLGHYQAGQFARCEPADANAAGVSRRGRARRSDPR